MRRFLFTFSTLLMAYISHGQTFEIDGISYAILSENPNNVEVSDKNYIGDIVLPDQVSYQGSNYSVSKISWSAFSNDQDLTSLFIPKTVVSLDYGVPCIGCSNLTAITVDEENQFFASINGLLYNKDITKLLEVPIGLDSITLPNSITEIGNKALLDCYKLKNVNIPSSVKTIGSNAFYHCTSLESLIIPDLVDTIKYSCFAECMELKSVQLGDSIKEIQDYAFFQCKKISSINIPNSVISIGESAFQMCYLLSIDSISESLNIVKDKAFAECTSLLKIELGNNLKSIGNYAFYNCTNLKTINFGQKLTEIGDYAFSWCTKLEKLNISNSVNKIGSRAFISCDSLTNVAFGINVDSIGSEAFSYCSNISLISCSSIIPPILGEDVFNNVPKNISLSVPLQSIELYKEAMQWKDFIIESITEINKQNATDNVLIFPNPFIETINVKNIPINSNITLLDLNGRIVYKENATNSTIVLELKDLKKGIYMMKINNEIVKLLKE